jgi:hypothetical protein
MLSLTKGVGSTRYRGRPAALLVCVVPPLPVARPDKLRLNHTIAGHVVRGIALSAHVQNTSQPDQQLAAAEGCSSTSHPSQISLLFIAPGLPGDSAIHTALW